MKKYYQPGGGKKGRFTLRENTYRRIWYLIADYPYFKAMQRGHEDAREFSRANSFRIVEPMFEYDIGREQCERYVAAIEDAMERIPQEYIDYIMSHIIDRKKYKDMDHAVSERTIKLWAQRFIWQVAHNLGEA